MTTAPHRSPTGTALLLALALAAALLSALAAGQIQPGPVYVTVGGVDYSVVTIDCDTLYSCIGFYASVSAAWGNSSLAVDLATQVNGSLGFDNFDGSYISPMYMFASEINNVLVAYLLYGGSAGTVGLQGSRRFPIAVAIAVSPSPSPSPSPLPGPSPSPSPLPSPSPSTSPDASPSPSVSPGASPSPSPSPDASPSPSVSPDASTSLSASPDASPSPSPSPGASPSPSVSPDASPSLSASPDASPSPSVSPGASPSPSASPDASPSPSPAPGASPSPSPSPAASPSPSASPGVSPSPSASPEASPSPNLLDCSAATFNPPILSSRLVGQICASNKAVRTGKRSKLVTNVTLSVLGASVTITDIVTNKATASWQCSCRPTTRDNCTCLPNAVLLGGGNFLVMPQWRRTTVAGKMVDTTLQVAFNATAGGQSCSGTAVICSAWGVRRNRPPPACPPFNSTGVTRPALTCI